MNYNTTNSTSLVEDSSKYMRYFIYSNEQFKLRRGIELKLGKSFVSGKVIINGQQKQFTEMIMNIEACRYTDADVVAYGDIRTMKYTMPISS